MSAKAQAAADTTEPTITEALYIGERDDDTLKRPSGSSHVYDGAEGTALCGHPATATRHRVRLPEARVDAHPVGDHRTCANCSKAVRSRIAAGDLSSGDETLDLLLRAEAGDELELTAGGERRRMTVTETDYSYNHVLVKGEPSNPRADEYEHYNDRMHVKCKPSTGIRDVKLDGDLTTDCSHDDGRVSRPLVADGGTVQQTQNEVEVATNDANITAELTVTGLTDERDVERYAQRYFREEFGARPGTILVSQDEHAVDSDRWNVVVMKGSSGSLRDSQTYER